MSWRVLVPVLVVVLGTALDGQQARPPAGSTDAQTPTFKVQVEYVEVDAQVTDQKGNLVRDLKKEDFSVRTEAEPSDALRLTVRPLKKDCARPNESDRVLKNEVCSAKFEVEPSEAVKVTVRPLKNEVPRPREPVKDLNAETCSTKLEVVPSEPLKVRAKALF